MEILFIMILVGLMAMALTSGFPVAFSLPGSAILTIGLAALCGYLFEGNPSAYFALDGPVEWLTAGVTNFRSLYWDVERDTLIAVPLFIFMGIMLERSKIAEDLLVTMAQLFGPIPGGLGISVVFVGALLAATTGIVGATVIAMGLISLPAMLRSNYSKPLATGTICASGTLGQIIPPSIVLIILADQLSNAADQANALRKADFRESTGSFSMPSHLDVTSASAGDMFMGAFLPGLVLVAIYMIYILVTALLKPEKAPPVSREGKLDFAFIVRVLVALVPPLSLIFAVLGSIVLGVATVNQAGAIGAIGSVLMGGYRLKAGQRGAYVPMILAVAAIAVIVSVLSVHTINVKNIQTSQDVLAVVVAAIAVVVLLVAILWSLWRAYRTRNILHGVMLETAKTTSMVFIILLGAAMLTAAFRGFGGEELVRGFLTGLPGGFWTQFIVVMAVIFILGFFLDFIEIAVVVVPIVAPILLADPQANVTAVWFGVMVGLNIQTSFLTPPFGFALFYLRGVAPPSVKTIEIYRGAAAFITLQLVGLAIAGYFPTLVNYLPNRIYLSSSTAPPPNNPKLQYCLQNYVFDYYDEHADELRASIQKMQNLDLSYLPEKRRQALKKSFDEAMNTFSLVNKVREEQKKVDQYLPEYEPLHTEVRDINKDIHGIDRELKESRQRLNFLESSGNTTEAKSAKQQVADLEARKKSLQGQIPDGWDDKKKRYKTMHAAVTRAENDYRRNVDNAYKAVAQTRTMISQADDLAGLADRFTALQPVVENQPPDAVTEAVKDLQRSLRELEDTDQIVDKLGDVRDAFRKDVDRTRAAAALQEARTLYENAVDWRRIAAKKLEPELDTYEKSIRGSIGLRMQRHLTDDQVSDISFCQAKHRDVSLYF